MHIQKDQKESVLYIIIPFCSSKYSLYISFNQMELLAELHIRKFLYVSSKDELFFF